MDLSSRRTSSVIAHSSATTGPIAGDIGCPRSTILLTKQQSTLRSSAPSHYKVVATGKLIEESNIKKNRTLTRYRESVPVSVKVMTIGVARFAVRALRRSRKHSHYDMGISSKSQQMVSMILPLLRRSLSFCRSYIGPYPFEKLAHVQSKTKFGGLENASNIFYFENSVNGKNEREELIAHETAHQWFW